jgi:ATP-dependent 26S proteasome regulatory subunit
MVTVMKLEKAPQETYADIGGLDTQIQEIKVQFNDLYNCDFMMLKISKTHF